MRASFPPRRPRRLRTAGVAVLATAAALVTAPAAPASPGEVEPGFGGPGFVLTDVGPREAASDVLVQPDGRVVAVGGTEEAALLVRYRPDGSLDPTFGAGGIVHGVPAEPAHPSAGALQPDGRIVVAGSDAGFDDFLVVRYLADGRLDPGFGTGGVVRTDFGDVDQAFAVAVQADGRIVAAGRSGPRLAVARYLPGGGLDAGFGTGGRVTTASLAPGGEAEATAVALLSTGGVVVGGRDAGSQGAPRMLLARYSAAGALEGASNGPGDGISALLVQSGDRVVAGGTAGAGERSAHVLTRFRPDGTVDAAFGTGGVTTTALGVFGNITGLAVDGAGRIVASGDAASTTDFPDAFFFATVERYSADGAPDPSFGCGGRTLVELPTPLGGRATGVAVSGEDIVLAGVAFRSREPDSADVLLLRVRGGGPEAAGYWIARADGGVSAFGSAGACGSLRGVTLNRPVVGHAGTPSGDGYWLVASDGGIFAFGDAVFRGSTGALRLNRPVVGMAPTPSGDGYWLAAADGGVFAFGDAVFRGSTGSLRLNSPVVGMAATPSGNGYWLVAADGGVFAFGDAAFRGSTGAIRLNRPMVGMAPTPSGNGYWLVAADGGVFAFGDAVFRGSTGALRLARPVVGMARTPSGGGYWLGAADGGVFAFGDAPFRGSTGASGFASTAVAVTARR